MARDYLAEWRAAAARWGVDPVAGSTEAQAERIVRALGQRGGLTRRAQVVPESEGEDVRERVHRPTEAAAMARVMAQGPRVEPDMMPVTLRTLRTLYPEVREEWAARRPAAGMMRARVAAVPAAAVAV